MKTQINKKVQLIKIENRLCDINFHLDYLHNISKLWVPFISNVVT